MRVCSENCMQKIGKVLLLIEFRLREMKETKEDIINKIE